MIQGGVPNHLVPLGSSPVLIIERGVGGHVSHGFSSETLRGKLILAVKRVTLYDGTEKEAFTILTMVFKILHLFRAL